MLLHVVLFLTPLLAFWVDAPLGKCTLRLHMRALSLTASNHLDISSLFLQLQGEMKVDKWRRDCQRGSLVSLSVSGSVLLAMHRFLAASGVLITVRFFSSPRHL